MTEGLGVLGQSGEVMECWGVPQTSKVGILLAYALLTVILHVHNTSMRVGGKLVVRPITASPLRGTPSTNPKPIGIMPKERVQQQGLQSADHWEIDISANIMDLGLILPLYLQSLQKLHILRELLKVKLTRLTTLIQHFKQFLPSQITGIKAVDTQIHSRLSNYGLTLSPTTKDGNCFFTAVAMNIMADMDSWSHYLTRNGIVSNITSDLDTLSLKLRQSFVHEITGERRGMYEDFFLEKNDLNFDYIREANKFHKNGFFASTHGDLMPMAMATLLQASIIIITTNVDSTPMYIVPMVGCAERSIFLLYTHTGPGHYDAALPYSKTVGQASPTSTSVKVGSCSCGVNKSHSGKSCAPSGVYATRCRCYLNSRPCTSFCRCKDCTNPCGIRPHMQQGTKRQRRQHSMQQQIPSSKMFALDRGESLSTAIWSDFESIVLAEICALGQQEDITKFYNDIVYYSKSSFCMVPLKEGIVFREKTTSQLSAKLEHMRANMRV